MLCAVELIGLKAVAIAEYEAEEKRKEEEALKAYKVAEQNAINLCENVISERLADCAKSRSSLETYLEGYVTTDRLDNEIFYRLKKDGMTYADGTISYTVNYDTGYSLKKLRDYLNDHCIEMEVKESSYMHWGCGSCRGDCIKVYVPVDIVKE